MSKKEIPVPVAASFLMPALASAPKVKIMINVGACMDIPTGNYLVGLHGEHILNGGVGFLTGIVGIGNNFKSTLMHYMTVTIAARMGNQTTITTYDTEINIHEWHLQRMMQAHVDLKGTDLIEEGRWNITDKTMYTGDQYYEIAKDFMQKKIKEKSKYMVTTPFIGRDGKAQQIVAPTAMQIDSFSEFSTQDVIKMQDENALGESGANMVSMRQGMQKNRVLMEIPYLTGGSYTYMFMTAHIGAEFNMDPRNPAPKKLQHLKGGMKLKGVPEKFTFTTNNCWHCYNAAPLINQSTKAPEYPRDSDDDMSGDTDLNVVIARQLRNKSGPSGMAVHLIVSQQEGLLPALTEFHYIKENGRWGLEGNDRNYTHAMCPEIALSRTAVRKKITAHPELRRALNISSEMLQMYDLWKDVENEYICTPKELYDDLKAMGYDWSTLLNTRGWWAPKGFHEDIPFLSTMDLLRMRSGKYIPYWLSSIDKAKIDKSKAKAAPIQEHYRDKIKDMYVKPESAADAAPFEIID